MGRDQFTSTGRIESFSDGVIAIIITIMILEFRLPENALDQGLWLGIVKPTAPKIMSYALSFLLLTQMWISHHALMHNARYATPILMWCNNNVLFWMSMIPFSTMILGSHPFTPTAVALYGLTLALTSVSFTFLRWLVMKQSDFHGETLNAISICPETVSHSGAAISLCHPDCILFRLRFVGNLLMCAAHNFHVACLAYKKDIE